MNDATLVKIRKMLTELGWSEEVIDDYCEEFARGEENLSEE
jgi:hypothetical protein